MSTQPPNQFPPNQPSYADQPPRKSTTLWWILGVVGVVLIGGGLLCCGGGYFAFQTTMDLAGQQVQAQVANDPVVVEHIGQVQSISMDPMAMGERNEPGVVVFRIEGSKGSGLLVGRQGAGGKMTDMVLEMPDGEAYPLGGADDAVVVPVEDGEQPVADGEQPVEDDEQ